jgi:hypothetical protein
VNEKNKTSAEILSLLRSQEPGVAIEAAMAYLQHAQKEQGQRFRLIDADTGNHVLRFEANGKTYRVLTSKDGIGLRRFAALRAAISQVGFEASLVEQLAQFKRIEQAFNKQEYMKAAAGVHDMMQAVTRGMRTYPYAAEACALFIVREGEDLKALPTQADVDEKVADWAEEGLHESDFFFLCFRWAQAWNEELADFSLLIQGRK